MREFTVDGVKYTDIVCNITRESEVKPSDISGMLLNRRYFNDVLGTYLRYTVEVIVPFGAEKKYAQLYETLSDPVGEHLFILPYNQVTVQFYGRIETISDKYFRKVNNKETWRETSFVVIANNPTKYKDLSDVVSQGILPLPPVSPLDNTKIYQVVNGEWEVSSLEDGNDNYY